MALKWSCGTMRDVAGASTFEIVKAPVNGCTSAQLEAVTRIEDEMSTARNAFGLHAEIQKVFDTRMEAITRACRKSKVLRRFLTIGIPHVSGEYGQGVNPRSSYGGAEHFVNWNSDFSESCGAAVASSSTFSRPVMANWSSSSMRNGVAQTSMLDGGSFAKAKRQKV